MSSSWRWRLYVIVDASAVEGRSLADVAQAAIQGGADVIQLRDTSASAKRLFEEAETLLNVTRPAKVPLIINDRADVAAAAGADGVHLGQDDLPVSAARAILGRGKLIGRSTHSVAQAIEADGQAVDYLAVGPIYPTPTKPDYPSVGLELIAQVRARVTKPVVVIGGVDQARMPDVLAAGAECVAVVRAVCAASDPQSAAQQLKQILKSTRVSVSPGL